MCYEAEKLWFNFEIIDEAKNLYTISWNGKTIYFKNVDGWLNSSYAFRVTKFKDDTYLLLWKKGLRIPETTYITKKEKDNYKEVLKNISFPVVSKPVDGTHGDGVVVNVKSMDELKNAIDFSFAQGTTKVIIQEQIAWDDYRIIVVGGEMIAASLRIPPFILWDGKRTVKELIDEENKNPLRGKGNHTTPMSQIKVDSETKDCIAEQWEKIMSIPPKGKKVFIRKNANLSTGGISIDVTDKVHPSIKKLVEESARALTLQVAWLDFVCTDISRPLSETRGAIIEANHTPWLRMHHFPSEGKSRNVAREILKLAFNN